MPADDDPDHWYTPDVALAVREVHTAATRSPDPNIRQYDTFDAGQITLIALGALAADIRLANTRNLAAQHRIDKAGLACMGADYHHHTNEGEDPE